MHAVRVSGNGPLERSSVGVWTAQEGWQGKPCRPLRQAAIQARRREPKPSTQGWASGPGDAVQVPPVLLPPFFLAMLSEASRLRSVSFLLHPFSL